jgi:Protein of unknown function (DUF3307)
MTLEMLFVLLVWTKFKHFLADFPLQGRYMLGKFKDGSDWILPLLSHVAVHGLFTLGLCLLVNPAMWWLCFLDMGIHFVTDRVKASKNLLGRWKFEDKMYWQILGLDQLIHGLTDILVLYLLIKF